MAKKQKLDKTSRILMIVLVAVVVLVAIALIGNSAGSDIKTLGALDYKIGALNEAGEYVKDTGSIVTKDFHNVEDLEIEIEKDALIEYRVYWYNEDEEFISCDAQANTDDYAGTAPEGATLFKLVITPTNDAEVSSGEIRGYANQLNVEFAK